MKRVLLSAISVIFTATVLNSCTKSAPVTYIQPPAMINSLSVTDAKPEFNKRKLGISGVHVNSINEQKKSQTKLHTYYFRHYSGGVDYYPANGTNEHMKMLTKAEKEAGVKLDANSDGKVTFNEILAFVTGNSYIKYFREAYIVFSFGKLDKNSDKKLSMDEFGQFNKMIKAKELPDFQLLEKFADYDYNSSRDLDVEEYEDFFMEYLLLKVGATK